MTTSNLSPPVPISADHVIAGFECGEASLDEWLKKRALKEQRFRGLTLLCRL